MQKVKLSDSRISVIGKEFATILNDYCIEVENYADWNENDFKLFADKNYDDFVQVALYEGIVDTSEKKYFKTYTDEFHDRIKQVAIDELKTLLQER